MCLEWFLAFGPRELIPSPSVKFKHGGGASLPPLSFLSADPQLLCPRKTTSFKKEKKKLPQISNGLSQSLGQPVT